MIVDQLMDLWPLHSKMKISRPLCFAHPYLKLFQNACIQDLCVKSGEHVHYFTAALHFCVMEKHGKSFPKIKTTQSLRGNAKPI